MTNRKIQLTTVVDRQTVDVFPNTKSEFVEFADGKTLEDKINKLGDAHGHSNATPDKDGFMSKEDKAKLDNVTNYTHPSTHTATMITEDATHRFVTDSEKIKWNNKADTTMASKINAGLMSASDKQRIDGLNADFKTRDDKITKNAEDIKSWNNEMINKEYQYFNGEDITIENSIVSKTTDMIVKGKTLQNFKSNVKNHISSWVDNGDNYSLDLPSGSGQPSILYGLTQALKENQKYTVIVNLVEYTSGVLHFSFMSSDGNKLASTTEIVAESKGVKKFVFTTNDTIKAETLRLLPRNGINNIYSVSKKILILEGDWTNKPIPNYFEGIKSFGEEESKISIWSHGKNLVKKNYYTKKEIKGWNGSSEDYATEIIEDGLKKGNIYCSFEQTGDVRFEISYSNSPIDITSHDTIANTREGLLQFFNCSSGEIRTIKNDYKYTVVAIRKFIQDSTLSKIIVSQFKTEYEPYKKDKKDISLKILGFDEGLKYLSSTVYDEINFVNRKAIKRVGKLIINNLKLKTTFK